jgi:hypothetical protein
MAGAIASASIAMVRELARVDARTSLPSRQVHRHAPAVVAVPYGLKTCPQRFSNERWPASRLTNRRRRGTAISSLVMPMAFGTEAGCCRITRCGQVLARRCN